MNAFSGSSFQPFRAASHSLSSVVDISCFAPRSRLSPETKQRRQHRVRGTVRLHLLLLVVFIICPSISASILPHIARSDLDISISTPQLPSGEIVSDDHQHESPLKQRARWSQRRDETTSDPSSSQPSPDLAKRSSSSFPTPFDHSIDDNFTKNYPSCAKFFDKFLSDTTFTNCHAISMLIRDSNSFFQSLHSIAATSLILDAACDASVAECSTKISKLASQLTSSSNCGDAYDANEPLVVGAYTDMIAYQPVYQASCLKNPTSGDYCFVDAISNSTNAADYDAYFLPLGGSFSDYPTCNECLQATMDVYSHWAQIDEQPLDQTYMPAAEKVNTQCGANFANLNVTVGLNKAVKSGSWTVTPDLHWMGGILAFSVMAWELI
ncbi:hypothetical protein ASPWEDRAFT_169592 [Aspergillus wentii DTO 134E9]|uniref:DUF7729 domain-containing protein n=1 Tax=Aspergillus wentii DTO 134E9 TaxID=1073089 RepID=A0A1L9RY55_ASPWE|nr:uncharacterized protein ASPWEDRAFT_169592 [Aspergillus wentii DTO 134E9]KAI9931564.1 hypothetical protein MW887_010141 [Aspergillus wentii]OJJ39767.1 hypothetical protein ASPWEDRAFT_169592 [Aspergillus wentii DTO 134E9]